MENISTNPGLQQHENQMTIHQERIQNLMEENAFYRYHYDEAFEKILNTPGLQHIAEKIFGYLNVKDLENCQEINQSSKKILDNPMFWLRKFRGLSKENRNDWTKVIQSVKNTERSDFIISYLKWNLNKTNVMNLPCYTISAVQDEFMKNIKKSCMAKKSSDKNTEIVKSWPH